MKNIRQYYFIDKLQNVPVAFSGIALGIGGLGNAWMNLYPAQLGWLKYVTMPIVIILILMLLTKNVFHHRVLFKEMKEPLLSSFLPTFTMCLMLISGFIAGFNHNTLSAVQIIGSILMCLAVFIQCLLIITFIFYVIKNHQWHNHPMYGSWFVPTVGLITACTVAPNFEALPPMFFEVIWLVGFIFFVVTFLPITYSLLFKARAQTERFPSIAVYFAPFNLAPSGFMQAFWFNNIQNGVFVQDAGFSQAFIFVMIIIMVPFGFAMSCFLYVFLIKIFKNKFAFIFASVSFPLAIGATTMILLFKMTMTHAFGNEIIYNNLLFKCLSWGSYILSNIFVICSTIIIIYVFVRMLILLVKLFIKEKKVENNIDQKINNKNPKKIDK